MPRPQPAGGRTRPSRSAGGRCPPRPSFALAAPTLRGVRAAAPPRRGGRVGLVVGPVAATLGLMGPVVLGLNRATLPGNVPAVGPAMAVGMGMLIT